MNTMKRIFVLLVILALIPLVCADPTADSLSVGSASGDPGATYVPVQVVITNVADGPIQGITLNVTYDSGVIELAAAAVGSDLPKDFLGDSLWFVKLGADKKRITMYTDNQSYALTDGTTGNILDLYFNVIGTAGQTSPIEISAVDVGSTELVHGTIPTINGTFTVTGGISGDLNGDGVVTSADAAIALQMAVRGEYDAMADVDDDNSVTSLDALLIMQVAADRVTI